jgi:hypothetical protein
MGVISGGVTFISGNGEIFIDRNYSGSSWTGGGDNFSSSIPADLYVYANCSSNVTVTTSVLSNQTPAKAEAAQIARH